MQRAHLGVHIIRFGLANSTTTSFAGAEFAASSALIIIVSLPPTLTTSCALAGRARGALTRGAKAIWPRLRGRPGNKWQLLATASTSCGSPCALSLPLCASHVQLGPVQRDQTAPEGAKLISNLYNFHLCRRRRLQVVRCSCDGPWPEQSPAHWPRLEAGKFGIGIGVSFQWRCFCGLSSGESAHVHCATGAAGEGRRRERSAREAELRRGPGQNLHHVGRARTPELAVGVRQQHVKWTQTDH